MSFLLKGNTQIENNSRDATENSNNVNMNEKNESKNDNTTHQLLVEIGNNNKNSEFIEKSSNFPNGFSSSSSSSINSPKNINQKFLNLSNIPVRDQLVPASSVLNANSIENKVGISNGKLKRINSLIMPKKYVELSYKILFDSFKLINIILSKKNTLKTYFLNYY